MPKQTATQQQTALEQTKELIEQAERFDRLIREPGWEDVLKFMANSVQVEIASATQHKYEAEVCRVMCICWNSKRELLDSTLGYIEGIQKSRDEIVAQYRKEKEEVHVGNESGY